MKKIYVFIPLFLIFVIIFTLLTPVAAMSEDISNKVFRLHIIANSNSTEDQKLKLKVRDNIMKEAAELFSDCSNINDAVRVSENNMKDICNIAQKTVSFYGYSYQIKAFVTKEFFNIREYDGFTLPAGIYNCLKIVIGEGNGKNWWCVMFPQVCISGCIDDFEPYLSDKEMEMITSGGYSVRFKVIEIYKKIIRR